MAKPRVHEIASEMGVDSKVALAKLRELGEFVKSPSSTLEPVVARKLRAALQSDLADNRALDALRAKLEGRGRTTAMSGEATIADDDALAALRAKLASAGGGSAHAAQTNAGQAPTPDTPGADRRGHSATPASPARPAARPASPAAPARAAGLGVPAPASVHPAVRPALPATPAHTVARPAPTPKPARPAAPVAMSNGAPTPGDRSAAVGPSHRLDSGDNSTFVTPEEFVSSGHRLFIDTNVFMDTDAPVAAGLSLDPPMSRGCAGAA